MEMKYVLLTAAKNEAACIGEVIQRVIRQSVLPTAWFIMDDGSVDETAAIVKAFAEKHTFIKLVSRGSQEKRNFGAQYRAVMAAYDLAKPLAFDCLGVQDADQAPERPDYYEEILQEFARNRNLGMASGVVVERHKGVWKSREGNSADSIAGGSAMFRRSAFDQVGGYTPLYYGCSDSLAQFEVEKAGWEIKTRPDLNIFHYRPTSSAGGIWRGLFKAGIADASLGYPLLFEVARCGRRLFYRPCFGGAIRFLGYASWLLRGGKPLVPAETVAFIRNRQLRKLRQWPEKIVGTRKLAVGPR